MNRCSKFVAMSIVALMIISTIAAIPLLNVSASNDTNATYTGDPITLVKGTPEKSYESFGLY